MKQLYRQIYYLIIKIMFLNILIVSRFSMLFVIEQFFFFLQLEKDDFATSYY